MASHHQHVHTVVDLAAQAKKAATPAGKATWYCALSAADLVSAALLCLSRPAVSRCLSYSHAELRSRLPTHHPLLLLHDAT